jgi:hypothetical protein
VLHEIAAVDRDASTNFDGTSEIGVETIRFGGFIAENAEPGRQA